MTIGLPPALLPVLSWIGTYLVHSTLLIGGLWLAWRVRPPRSAAVRAGGWQLVLLAGLYNDDCTPVVDWLKDAQPEVAARCIAESGGERPAAATVRTVQQQLVGEFKVKDED